MTKKERFQKPKKKSAPLMVYPTQEQKVIIEQAASTTGQSRSSYMIEASLEAAMRHLRAEN